MAELERIKRVESEDKRHALEVMRTSDNRYRFDEFEWKVSRDDVDRLVHGDGYWSFGRQSGLYESAEAAEADARQMLPWLKECGT